jgi:hypothetical protein
MRVGITSLRLRDQLSKWSPDAKVGCSIVSASGVRSLIDMYAIAGFSP